jgi:hypothetical protein
VEELASDDPRYIGPYRLLGRLGSGGMGHVFLGHSPGGRRVAVKVIRPDLADAPDFRRRFGREVAAAQRVSGMFTAPVVDADPAAPQPWLVTAYVDGPSLADHIARNGAMAEREVLRLGCALAEGIAAIHAAGIVHRDLKPSNVLLASDGPRIIDFGISRAAEETSLTQSGMVFGSPGFMSPEQADGSEIGNATDVFSLGAVLAFAATGTDPFGSGASSALLYRVVHAEPDLTGLSADLYEVVSACLRKNPAERPTPGQLIAKMNSLGVAGYSHADLSSQRPASLSARPPTEPPVAVQHTAPVAGATRRRSRWPLVALCVAIAVAVGAGAAFAFHPHGNGTPPAAGSADASGRSTTGPKPGAVVRAYFAAINAHDWPLVWRLGGKNLSLSYRSMVAGFRDTDRDFITDLTAVGNAVTVHIRAFDTTRAVQVYVMNYTVSGRIISGGAEHLLTTYSPCPHIQIGADGTAGPLFCPDGQPNPPVLAYYRKLHLRVFKLGPDATPPQVLHAMCFDLRQRSSTYPIETAAYELARKIKGWSFGISPPQEMRDGGC